MGNLSNLYVSKSFQSLIHLGTDSSATSTLTTLQDGLGNSIGIEVSTAGNLYLSGSLTASLEQGYVLVGNSAGKTSAFATSSLVTNINTGSLVTTSSFNSYTASTDSSINQLNASSASQQISINALNTNSGSVNSSITQLNASSASQQISINALNAATSSYVTSAITASSLVTASFSGNTLTFRKGDNTTFGIVIPDVSGSTINTGSFATTGSNTFTGNQEINGQLIVDTGGNQFILRSGGSGSTIFSQNASSKTLQLFQIEDATGIDIFTNVNISANLTASLQQGYVWVGNSAGRTTTVATSSFGTTINTGSFTTTSSFNSYTASTDSSISQLNASSASQQISINNLNTTTASLLIETQNLELFSASVLVSISNLNASSASQQISINALNAATSSYLTSSADITSLNAFTASQLNINSGYNTFTSSANQRLSSLETTSASVNTSISALNTFSSSTLVSLTNINSATASLNTSASLGLVTASFSGNTLTFTKGNGTTFGILLPDVSGSDISALNAFTASQLSINSGYNTFTQSIQTQVNNLQSVTGSYTLTSSFNAYTQSNDQRVSSLEVNSASVNVSITNVNNATASLFTSVNNINSFTSSTQISINALNASSASQQISIDALNTNSASVNSSITQLNASSASQQVSIDNLNSFSSSQLSKDDVLASYTGSNDTKWSTLGGQSGSWITESETSSFARTDISNTFTGDQNFNNNVNVTQNLTVTGNLYVSGSEVIISSSTLIVGDRLIEVNANRAIGDAGIYAFDAIGNQTGSLIWDPFVDYWKAGLSGSETRVITAADTASMFANNTGSFATTGSNIFNGNQTISGSLFVSGSEVLTGTLSASALRVENNTWLDGTLRVVNDATFTGDVTIQSASPKLLLRDTSGGGFSSGYDLRVDTGSFEIYDDTHNRDVLSDFFNVGTQQHTTSLTSEIIVISGSTSVTLIGNVSASIISASTINGLGDPLAFSTSVDSRLDSLEGISGSYATTGSNTFTGRQNFTQPITASVITFPTGSFGNGINLFQDGLSQIRFYSGSTTTQVGTWVNLQTNPSNGALAISSFPSNNHFVDFDVETTSSIFASPIKGFGGTLQIGSNTNIGGNVKILGGNSLSIQANTAGSGSQYSNAQLVVDTTTDPANIFSAYQAVDSNNNGLFGVCINSYSSQEGGVPAFFMYGGGQNVSNTPIMTASPNDNNIKFWKDNNNFSGNVNVTGSTNIQALTASLQQGYVWVGNASGRTTTVATSSFGGGAAFPFTGSAQITGSLGITGSLSGLVNTLSISSQTASLDFNNGNFFTLQLVSGSITHLTATNIKPGQTINLLVKMDSGSAAASGSLTFSPTFKFAGGFDYTPTAITGSQDIVSFVTFDTTQIFATQVKNLS